MTETLTVFVLGFLTGSVVTLILLAGYVVVSVFRDRDTEQQQESHS